MSGGGVIEVAPRPCIHLVRQPTVLLTNHFPVSMILAGLASIRISSTVVPCASSSSPRYAERLKGMGCHSCARYYPFANPRYPYLGGLQTPPTAATPLQRFRAAKTAPYYSENDIFEAYAFTAVVVIWISCVVEARRMKSTWRGRITTGTPWLRGGKAIAVVSCVKTKVWGLGFALIRKNIRG